MRRAGLVCLAGLAIVGHIRSNRCWNLLRVLGCFLRSFRESTRRVFHEGLGSFGGGAGLVALERLNWRRSADNISVAGTASDVADRVSANWLWRLLSAWVTHSGAKVERMTVTEKALCSAEACRCWVSGAGS